MMKTASLTLFLLPPLFYLLLAGAAAQAHSGNTSEDWTLTVPTRRSHAASSATPPSLPAAANDVTPSTVDIVIRRQSPSGRVETLRQTISRTSERIHVAGPDGREWLFERNPIDPRRAGASLVDHASQAIVLFEESDLRMALGIRGWADVLALGVEAPASRAADRQGTRSTRLAVDRIRPGADAGLLEPPVLRFPTYRVYDRADWLEPH
jgi:hypothetical protein